MDHKNVPSKQTPLPKNPVPDHEIAATPPPSAPHTPGSKELRVPTAV